MPEFIATLAAGLFAGAAGHISLVEHWARLQAGPAVAMSQFRSGFPRARSIQATLTIIVGFSFLAEAMLQNVLLGSRGCSRFRFSFVSSRSPWATTARRRSVRTICSTTSPLLPLAGRECMTHLAKIVRCPSAVGRGRRVFCAAGSSDERRASSGGVPFFLSTREMPSCISTRATCGALTGSCSRRLAWGFRAILMTGVARRS
jgi:hypothetical protein